MTESETTVESTVWTFHTAPLRTPETDGPGWWVGAPSITHHPRYGFLLAYRLRAGDGRRGFAVRVAQSDDGVSFRDVWQTVQQEWTTPSFERPCIRPARDGIGLDLWLSYVDPDTDRWRVDRLSAPDPDGFARSRAVRELSAEMAGLGSVKDPFLWRHGNDRYCYVSCTPAFTETDAVRTEIERSHDPFTVNDLLSMTGLFHSHADGPWQWRGMVLEPRPGTLDGHTARLTGILPLHPHPWVFYDANHDRGANYDEYSELAILKAPDRIERPLAQEPFLRQLAPGLVRYVDAVTVGSRLYCYYEHQNPSGSHDLRVTMLNTGGQTA